MTTITVNVIRKFSGNYTYTIDDTGRITYPEKPQEPEKFRRVSRAKTPAQTSPAPAAKITPARVQVDPYQAAADVIKARVQAPAAEPVQADPEPTPARLMVGETSYIRPVEYLNLHARGTVESFQAPAADFYQSLKGLGKKVFITIADYVFPAHIIAAACKLAGDEKAICKIEHERGARPILIVKLGRAVYRFFAQVDLPDGARLVTVSI